MLDAPATTPAPAAGGSASCSGLGVSAGRIGAPVGAAAAGAIAARMNVDMKAMPKSGWGANERDF